MSLTLAVTEKVESTVLNTLKSNQKITVIFVISHLKSTSKENEFREAAERNYDSNESWTASSIKIQVYQVLAINLN